MSEFDCPASRGRDVFRLRQVLQVCFCALVFVSVAAAQQLPPAPPSFRFGEVDLEFLDQTRQLDKKFEDQGLVYHEPELTAFVNRVGQSLLKPEDQLENVTWQFRVYRDPVVNAFALPNGSIYIFTGLLARVENEAQLAGILAHEIVHVRNRHGYLSYRSYRKKMLTINILSAVGAYSGMGGWGASLAAQFMLAISVIGYSRELEKEADLTGAQLLAASPYDAREMVNALECLKEKYEVDLAGEPFYGDHPKTKDRIAYLTEWVTKSASQREAKAVYPGSSKEEYRKSAEAVTRHNVELAIDAGLYRTAVGLGRQLVDNRSDSAANGTSLANAYTALGPRPTEPTEEEKTGKGKRDARKRRSKLTLQEEERTLAATSAGQELQKANYAEAEKLFRRATELDQAYALAWRGWGELAEKQNQPQAAIDAYQEYLVLQPAAMDRLLIMRRIKTLEAKLPPKQ
jgi:predicted Zn-dependent protease